jgi:multiple sugar transport system ATP-binding protein
VPHVEIKNVTKRFGNFAAISHLDLSVEHGEFCALLGPSGCGKSTLLRMISGLEAVTDGKIFIDGVDVTDVHPAKRRIAMVFQSYALYPHMTVRQNIAFSLDVAHAPKDEAKKRVDEVARMLQLEDLLDRKPAQLSGGQRQRVAIGRSLVRDPEVFLFDEPLSNLDAMLRVQMRLELANLHQQLKTTMIYVTHDQVEAMTLADRIVVLDRGEISQVGTPLELYNKPQNRFVASFIGSPSMNFLPATVKSANGLDADIDFGGAGSISITTRKGASDAAGQNLEAGIRPEHIRITDPAGALSNIKGTIKLAERLGNATMVHVDTAAGPIVVQEVGDSPAKAGDEVGLVLDRSRVFLFGANAQVI